MSRNHEQSQVYVLEDIGVRSMHILMSYTAEKYTVVMIPGSYIIACFTSFRYNSMLLLLSYSHESIPKRK